MKEREWVRDAYSIHSEFETKSPNKKTERRGGKEQDPPLFAIWG